MKDAAMIIDMVLLLFTLAEGALLNNSQEIREGNGKVITEEVAVSDFTQLNIAGPMDYFLVDNTSQSKVLIKTHSNFMESVTIEQQNGSLNIHLKDEGDLPSFKTFKIYVPVSQEALKGINHSGSGKMVSEVVLSAESLELNHSGSGEIVAEVNNRKLKTSTSGEGKIKLDGKAAYVEMNLSGSGRILGKNMLSKMAHVNLSGSGKVKVHANEHLKVTISGTGHVYYKGKPDNIEQSISGNGKITPL